jgi:hypothetical protein
MVERRTKSVVELERGRTLASVIETLRRAAIGNPNVSQYSNALDAQLI